MQLQQGASRHEGLHLEYRKLFRKTVFCRFSQYGACNKGTQCEFAHSWDECQPKPDLTKTALCRLWKRGLCQQPAEFCQFAHGQRELQRPGPAPPVSMVPPPVAALPEPLVAEAATLDMVPLQQPLVFNSTKVAGLPPGLMQDTNWSYFGPSVADAGTSFQRTPPPTLQPPLLGISEQAASTSELQGLLPSEIADPLALEHAKPSPTSSVEAWQESNMTPVTAKACFSRWSYFSMLPEDILTTWPMKPDEA